MGKNLFQCYMLIEISQRKKKLMANKLTTFSIKNRCVCVCVCVWGGGGGGGGGGEGGGDCWLLEGI